MTPRFLIVKVISGVAELTDQYRIIEQFHTSDGLRCRVCPGRYTALRAADEEVERRKAIVEESAKYDN